MIFFNDCFLYGEDDHGTYVATPGKSLTDLKGELSADIVESKSRKPDTKYREVQVHLAPIFAQKASRSVRTFFLSVYKC